MIYLFDFDGTLVDSMSTFISVMTKMFSDSDIPFDNEVVKAITPLGCAGIADYYTRMGVGMTEEEVVDLVGKYMLDEYTYRIPAKTNVISVIKKLKDSGARLNVLTASPHMTLDPCLNRLGIYDLFDNVWSCDDFKTTKADVMIYKKAADKLGVDTCDVLFLDDNYNACKTAKDAGMKVCGVYDDTSGEFVEDIKSVTDYYITDFSELLEL